MRHRQVTEDRVFFGETPIVSDLSLSLAFAHSIVPYSFSVKAICRFVCMLFLESSSIGAFAQYYEFTGAPLRGVQIETVAYKAWLPETSAALRGTLVLIPGSHADGREMAADPAWQELGASVSFAVLACQFAKGHPYLYQQDERGEVARAINTAVRTLAVQCKHPELALAPLALWGASAGSNVAVRYTDFFPERVAALASSKGTYGAGMPGQAKAGIPMFFALGMKDNPAWLNASKLNINEGLRRHAPWTVACQKNEGHGDGKSLQVVRPFLKAAINLRLSVSPVSATPGFFKSAPPSLSKVATPMRSVQITSPSSWFGDPETYAITAAAAFRGDRARAVWLPDEATARAWQAYLRE